MSKTVVLQPIFQTYDNTRNSEKPEQSNLDSKQFEEAGTEQRQTLFHSVFARHY